MKFLDKILCLKDLPENVSEYKIEEKRFHIELSVNVSIMKKILDSSLIVEYFSNIFKMTEREKRSLSKMRRQELRNLFYSLGKTRFRKIKYKK